MCGAVEEVLRGTVDFRAPGEPGKLLIELLRRIENLEDTVVATIVEAADGRDHRRALAVVTLRGGGIAKQRVDEEDLASWHEASTHHAPELVKAGGRHVGEPEAEEDYVV